MKDSEEKVAEDCQEGLYLKTLPHGLLIKPFLGCSCSPEGQFNPEQLNTEGQVELATPLQTQRTSVMPSLLILNKKTVYLGYNREESTWRKDVGIARMDTFYLHDSASVVPRHSEWTSTS